MGSARLREVLDRIEASFASNDHPVVVFDLDSTLFDTAHRNLRILTEFVDAHDDEWPGLRAAAEKVTVEDMGWNVLKPLRRYGFHDDDMGKAYLTFWGERFFTDEYVAVDEPHPGAVEFATACHERGALLYYLTGRHVGGMELGTVRGLTRHGFPFWRGRTVLHLKPAFDIPDEEYKDAAVRDIRSHRGTVIATFENEPGNANLFRKAFPEALHFLVETDHSPEAPPLEAGIQRIPDFQL